MKSRYLLTNGMHLLLGRNGDRYMKCASCKATADVMLRIEKLDGSVVSSGSTCKRHLKLNAQRAVNRALEMTDPAT